MNYLKMDLRTRSLSADAFTQPNFEIIDLLVHFEAPIK